MTSWESRYFVEGRDNLNGDALWVNSIEYSWQSLVVGAWYGSSPEQSYDELQLAVAWHENLSEELGVYLAYTHLRFPSDDDHDHDLGLGLSYAGGPLAVEYALDAYYSTRADGFFAEASASRAWELTDALSADLEAILGMNQGYVADGHDGANHTALSLGLSYVLSESLTLGAHGTYSWAIKHKAGAADDASLKDFFHAGVGLEWSF